MRYRVLFFAVSLVAGTVAAAAAAAAPAGTWQRLPDAPQARTEVVAVAVGGRVAVAGGYLADGSSSARVDLYEPARRRWARLPDLRIGVNHAMAAASGPLLYVAGGYTSDGSATARAFVLDTRRTRPAWRELPPMPEARAAGGAAVVAGRLHVVGGVVGPGGGLAERSFSYEPGARRWRAFAAPPTQSEMRQGPWPAVPNR